MSWLPHFLESQLTDAGEAVSITCRLLFNPRKISGTNLKIKNSVTSSRTGPLTFQLVV
jgi:hypothetical protein